MIHSRIIRPADVFPFVSKYAKCRQENFLALTLSAAHDVIKVHHITKGLVNQVLVHPRECFFPAIVDNAVALIFAHNHPSGSLSFSPEDMGVARRLCEAGSILGFHILDHIVFTRSNRLSSLREEGTFPVEFDKENFSQCVADSYLYGGR